jgi:hypothetical protein
VNYKNRPPSGKINWPTENVTDTVCFITNVAVPDLVRDQKEYSKAGG